MRRADRSKPTVRRRQARPPGDMINSSADRRHLLSKAMAPFQSASGGEAMNP
jgi:hypothetical protein